MRAATSLLSAITIAIVSPAMADEYTDMAQFAQSICGDIPSGSLTKTTIKGAVQANAGVLARIFSGGADVGGDKVQEIYNGIPLDKLPDNIPTVSMCKSELIKVLLARKKTVANTCSNPDFGQTGWRNTQDYSDSSGRVDGGHDQNWWCNQVASSFLGSRSIKSPSTVQRLASNEESSKDWKGHVTYKYHCSIRVSWDPVFAEKQDAAHCGTHEE